MIENKYGTDASAHPTIDEDAYKYAAGEATRGILYGLGSTPMSTRRLPGFVSSQCGSSRGSRSSQSSDRDHTPGDATGHGADPAVIRRLDMIEERLQPLAAAVDSTHLHTVVRDVMQEELQIMRDGVIADVTSHVTSNVAEEVALRVSDLVADRVNNKFITELRASEERQKKQRMVENRVRDRTLLDTMLRSVRRQMGEPEDDQPGDETQPPPDSQQ